MFLCLCVCPRFRSSVSHFAEATLMMFTDPVSGADEADMNVGHDFVMSTATRACMHKCTHARMHKCTHARIVYGLAAAQ